MQTLHLFHGRDSLDETMNDWGYDGPTLIIGGLHVTYNATFWVLCEDGNWYELSFPDGGLLEYEGKFYGDWSINEAPLVIGPGMGFEKTNGWYDPQKTMNKGG